MKVVFQYQGLITDEYKNFFVSNVPNDIDLYFSESSDPDAIVGEIEDAEVLVGYRLSENLIEHATKLRHIQIPWTGFNNLGKEFLEGKSGITVSNSHSNSLAIAEHAVALLCAAAKLVPYRHNHMMEGDWSPRRLDVNSFWLTGKTSAILGYGAIGSKIAKMLKMGFNHRILAMKRDKMGYTKEDEQIVDFKGGAEDLDYLVNEADYIIVAVPLTNETEGLLGEHEFNQMKSTAIIVNIARGPIIDEKNLYNALKSGEIGAAGIDTWYNYPSGGNDTETFQNYPFEELENIVMSPHSAFKVRDRVEIFSQHILENILRIHDGQEPINQVNLDIGY